MTGLLHLVVLAQVLDGGAPDRPVLLVIATPGARAAVAAALPEECLAFGDIRVGLKPYEVRPLADVELLVQNEVAIRLSALLDRRAVRFVAEGCSGTRAHLLVPELGAYLGVATPSQADASGYRLDGARMSRYAVPPRLSGSLGDVPVEDRAQFLAVQLAAELGAVETLGGRYERLEAYEQAALRVRGDGGLEVPRLLVARLRGAANERAASEFVKKVLGAIDGAQEFGRWTDALLRRRPASPGSAYAWSAVPGLVGAQVGLPWQHEDLDLLLQVGAGPPRSLSRESDSLTVRLVHSTPGCELRQRSPTSPDSALLKELGKARGLSVIAIRSTRKTADEFRVEPVRGRGAVCRIASDTEVFEVRLVDPSTMKEGSSLTFARLPAEACLSVPACKMQFEGNAERSCGVSISCPAAYSGTLALSGTPCQRGSAEAAYRCDESLDDCQDLVRKADWSVSFATLGLKLCQSMLPATR